jgi:hypothetical protein
LWGVCFLIRQELLSCDLLDHLERRDAVSHRFYATLLRIMT